MDPSTPVLDFFQIGEDFLTKRYFRVTSELLLYFNKNVEINDKWFNLTKIRIIDCLSLVSRFFFVMILCHDTKHLLEIITSLSKLVKK